MTSTIILPRDYHSHTIIWLHGRDSYAAEFCSELFESEASQPEGQPRTLPDLFPTIKWVFPQAPLLRAERFDVENMSQWFDMWSVENPLERPELQEPGLRTSIYQILNIVRQEDLPSDKIFLAGISQGFATVISAVLASDDTQFAGLIGLCSWLPPFADNILNTPINPLVRETPVFLAHSSDDEVVPIDNGKHLRDTLRIHMEEVEWKEYEEGGHWVNEPEGVDDIAGFLRANM
ncbi:lysophospholipase II [Hypomontagnella monticulosa]|nr:lysophospholipase II [Hypomontagnella monticulosa]